MTTDLETLVRFYGAEFPDTVPMRIIPPRKPRPIITKPRPTVIAWGRSLGIGPAR
jgi:hypothetical protein